jgi:hypothetical protein
MNVTHGLQKSKQIQADNRFVMLKFISETLEELWSGKADGYGGARSNDL